MFFKPKLVQFGNGKFGLRRYWFFRWYFADLYSPQYSWHRHSNYFKDCMGDRERAEELMHYAEYRIVKTPAP